MAKPPPAISSLPFHIPPPQKVWTDAKLPVNTDSNVAADWPQIEDAWTEAIGADLYAGYWTDHNEGIICIQVLDIAAAQKRIGNTDPYPYEPWKFAPAKYTYVHLMEAKELLTTKKKALGIVSVMIYAEYNTLRISMLDRSDATLEDLIELTGIETILLEKRDFSGEPQDT